MLNITLVGTYHSREGKCNEDELFGILEGIRPDVIFEETPPTYYNAYYVERTRDPNVEHAAISSYCNHYGTPHVPVDSDDVPSDSFFSEHKRITSRVRGGANRFGWNHRSVSELSYRCIYSHGFKYLNSDQFTRHNDELTEILESALKEMGDEQSLEFLRQYDLIIDKRENEMLTNIYRYSTNHQYDHAVFLIGAGHRKTIVPKILGHEGGGITLNWKYYVPSPSE